MIIVILLLLVFTNSKLCVNNEQMKYQIKEITRLTGTPHPYCQEYLLRTCCGTSNIDSVKEKIERMFQSKYQLSIDCKDVLTTLLCSPCDGDVGTGEKAGICPQFSNKIFQACRNDYFLFEINGVLGPCTHQSIACSQLHTIFQSSNSKIAQLFGFKQTLSDPFSKTQCFNGISSVLKKGASASKSHYIAKSAPPRRNHSEPDLPINDLAKNLFMSVGILMGATILIMKCLRKNQNQQDHDE